MALITCKECGKQISDTIYECIHCGAVLKQDVLESNEDQEAEKLVDFNDLPLEQQKKYVNEFLKSDKLARKTRNYLATVSSKMWACLLFALVTSYMLFGLLERRSLDIPILDYELVVLNRTLYWIMLGVTCILCIWAWIALLFHMVKPTSRSFLRKSMMCELNFKTFLEVRSVFYHPTLLTPKQIDVYNELLESEN